MFRLLFGLPESPIDRRTYVACGASLMALKYLVDAVVIAGVTGMFWTPADYLLPMVSFSAEKVAAFPRSLDIFLLIWTLPFAWAGVVLSARRALDADLFQGLVVLFFVPVLNYLLMAVLAIVPTRTRQYEAARPGPGEPDVFSDADGGAAGTRWGMAAGVVAGVSLVVTGVVVFRTYGAAIFLGAPFVVGLLSAIVSNSVGRQTRRKTVLIGQAALAVIGAAILFLAVEGAICLIMALPIASPLAVIGSLLGYGLVERRQPPTLTRFTVLLLALPFGAAIEAAMPAVPTRVVMTAVEVNAPPAVVWRHVISFSEIQSAPAWYFRTGLAYPLRARLDGTGAGAVRHCEFTTGAFVEPITVWDEPRILAFDVASQPAPLHEWSPYSKVYAPHLDGFFRTSRGEFRLVGLGGTRTRLEGRTWYSLEMQPAVYWQGLADTILHAVHRRVLEHVKAQAEQEK